MTTTATRRPTEIPCPSWCSTDHSDMPPGQGFHASNGYGVETPGPLAFRLWQTDTEGAAQVVVIGGQTLTSGQAHDLGLDLAERGLTADEIRRVLRRR